jgi:hypothetical protein
MFRETGQGLGDDGRGLGLVWEGARPRARVKRRELWMELVGLVPVRIERRIFCALGIGSGG